LLVDVAAMLASGGPASVMDFGRDPVEAGKRLDAMMLCGDPLIAIDNVEAPLEGAVLCQMHRSATTWPPFSMMVRAIGRGLSEAPDSLFMAKMGQLSGQLRVGT
jgi:hypothetical protein